MGSDVAAGTYMYTAGKDGVCSWMYLPKKTSNYMEGSPGGSSFGGPAYAELNPGEIVYSVGCVWTKES